MSEGMIEVNGGRLYYEDTGSDRAVVLIHAGIADSRMWDGVYETLAEHCRAIRYDLRGYGWSSYPDAPFSHHDDLGALIRSLGVGRATLVGCSMGGRIAVDTALTHPDIVEALVLLNAPVQGYQWSEAMHARWADEEAALARGDIDAAVEVNLRMWVDGPRRTPDQVDPAMRARAAEMIRGTVAIPEPPFAPGQLDPPAISRLAEIRAPVLLITGDREQPDIDAVAQLIHETAPHSRRASIAGAHMASIEHPEAFRRLVLAFVTEVAG